MNRSSYLGTLLFLLVSFAASPTDLNAAVIWVGGGTFSCDVVVPEPVYPNLALALGAAIAAGDDEIRLTDTVSHTGQKLTLTDWYAGSVGRLTISGGYANCGSPQVGRTTLQNTNGDTILVKTASQPSSEVTLKNIEIAGSFGRGLVAEGKADVTLVNVDIHDNNYGGVSVHNSASLSLDVPSRIRQHETNLASNRFNYYLEQGGGILCNGSGATVSIAGQLIQNSAKKGGGIYIGSGCVVELRAGSVIQGDVSGVNPSAEEGGGVYVDAGGILVASGGSNRVVFRDIFGQYGAGLYLYQNGFASLLNTLFLSNHALYAGAGIYAKDGGTDSYQLIMDRAATCPFLISCSEFDSLISPIDAGIAVHAVNSKLLIQRTIFDISGGQTIDKQYMLYATDGAIIDLNTSGIVRSKMTAGLFATNGAEINVKHLTFAGNTGIQATPFPKFAVIEGDLIKGDGHLDLRNSLVSGVSGVTSVSNGISGRCNVFNTQVSTDPLGFPDGALFARAYAVSFINAAGGDIRLQTGSGGIDVCDAVEPSPTLRDIEYQIKPVDDVTVVNQPFPAGVQDDPAFVWDVGFDEVRTNYTSNTLKLTITFGGDGDGRVISTWPPGVDCTSSCQKNYAGSTAVTLQGLDVPGSAFAAWTGCDQVSGADNQICKVFLTTSDRSVVAAFEGGVPQPEMIFMNGFED